MKKMEALQRRQRDLQQGENVLQDGQNAIHPSDPSDPSDPAGQMLAMEKIQRQQMLISLAQKINEMKEAGTKAMVALTQA